MSLNLEEWGNSSFLHLSVCCWMIHICCVSVHTQQQDLSREGRGCSLWPRNSNVVSCLKTDMRKWSIFPWDALLYRVTGWNCNISMRLLFVFYNTLSCCSHCLWGLLQTPQRVLSPDSLLEFYLNSKSFSTCKWWAFPCLWPCSPSVFGASRSLLQPASFPLVRVRSQSGSRAVLECGKPWIQAKGN